MTKRLVGLTMAAVCTFTFIFGRVCPTSHVKSVELPVAYDIVSVDQMVRSQHDIQDNILEYEKELEQKAAIEAENARILSNAQYAQEYFDKRGVKVPSEYTSYFEHAGNIYGISPSILMAIGFKESRYTPNVSNGRCKGLMQVNVDIHRNRLNAYGGDWSNPNCNICAAADLLSELLKKYGNVQTALAAYGGERNPYSPRPSAYVSDLLTLATYFDYIEEAKRRNL